MHNIHELEQKWLKYKIKFYLPYLITVFFLIILIITLYFIVNSKDQKNTIASVETNESTKKEKLVVAKEKKEDTKITKVQTQEPKQPEVKEIQEVQPAPTQEVQEQQTAKNEIVLTPSLDFMKKLRTDSFNTYNSEEQHSYSEPAQTNQQKQAVIEEEETEVQESEKKPTINITTKEEKDDIKDVIKRFEKNNNPTLSLFIAKKYYKLGEYQKAYNYALITNEINNDIEESWLIFAKSLTKLDKRDKAIQTLIKYVNHSGSGNAKILLDDIRAGKFK